MTPPFDGVVAARSGVRDRWRHARGVAVTVLAVSASVLSSFFVFGAEGVVPGQVELQPDWRAGVGVLAALAAAVALCWRHHNPVVVTAIAVVPPLVFISDALAALIALAALAAARRDHLLWLGTAAVYAATAVALWHDGHRDPEVSPLQQLAGAQTTAEKVDIPLMAVLLIAAVLTAIPLGVGLLRGTRRALSRSERGEQQLLAEMTRREERSRIAREMHDVLGHRLSLLSLQAGALEVNSGKDPARLSEVAYAVRGTARQALDDLRQVVGVLRDGHGPAAPGRHDTAGGATLPGLADLPDLITNSRRAGMTLNVILLLDNASGAPAQVGAACYRIVQEALTNILRHAPNTPGEVSVRGGPGAGLTIEIRNPLPDGARSLPNAGQHAGLAGIAERAAALGGNASTGPTADGAFAVAAWLPWPGRS